MILSIFLTFSLLDLSQARVLFQRTNDRIVATSTECSELEEQVPYFSQWMKQTGDPRSCKVPTPVSRPSGTFNMCDLDITDCAPEHVRKYHGLTTKEAGPNCWNLSLVMSQMIPSMRYSSDQEFSYYLRPPLCRQLSNTEKREPGDIGALRRVKNNKEEEVHGFVFISDQYVYSKNNLEQTYGYGLQSISEVMTEFRVENRKECQQNESNPNCSPYLNVFRCQSMAEYLKSKPAFPSELNSIIKRIENAECSLEHGLFKGKAELSPEWKNNVIDVAKALNQYLAQNRSQFNGSDNANTFMMGALQLRLQSMADQLDVFDEFYMSNNMKPFADQIRKEAQNLRVGTN